MAAKGGNPEPGEVPIAVKPPAPSAISSTVSKTATGAGESTIAAALRPGFAAATAVRRRSVSSDPRPHVALTWSIAPSPVMISEVVGLPSGPRCGCGGPGTYMN